MTPAGCIDLRDVDEGKFYGFGAVIEGCKRRIVQYGAGYFWYDDEREHVLGCGALTVKGFLTQRSATDGTACMLSVPKKNMTNGLKQ